MSYPRVALKSLPLSKIGDLSFLARAQRRIVHGDAAAISWHEFIGDRSWKFVSNLPYAITSLALRKALWSSNPPEIVVALVQRGGGTGNS